MRFQHALIQSHIHALLLTLRKVAMSIKYNTKWPFDLITCRVRCTIITQWSGNDIPVNLFCSWIFIFYKTSVFAMKNTVLIVLLVTYNEAFLKSGVNNLLCFQNIFAIMQKVNLIILTLFMSSIAGLEADSTPTPPPLFVSGQKRTASRSPFSV